ncbi:MAG: hypothetical protein KFF49_01250 [Bacteroidales bacterium]|nr:hypothetical protein [Bacteroidales bacterium]
MKTPYYLVLILTTIIFSCADEKPLYMDASTEPAKRAEDLLQRMTMEEKFWQMYMIPGDLGKSDEISDPLPCAQL